MSRLAKAASIVLTIIGSFQAAFAGEADVIYSCSQFGNPGTHSLEGDYGLFGLGKIKKIALTHFESQLKQTWDLSECRRIEPENQLISLGYIPGGFFEKSICAKGTTELDGSETARGLDFAGVDLVMYFKASHSHKGLSFSSFGNGAISPGILTGTPEVKIWPVVTFLDEQGLPKSEFEAKNLITCKRQK